MARRSFAKYEGLANDFILMGAVDEAEISPELAKALCDRRRGIGADGVLVVLPPRDPACVGRMKVINADGSIAEMCGNGLRCVALHVARARGASVVAYIFDTDAGPRGCMVDDAGGSGLVTVDMGAVRLTGTRKVELDGAPLELYLADVGNPHAVALGDFSRKFVDRVGPRVSTHSSFPRGTNVEFARVQDGAIDLVVWERGVGVTSACGTGACAAVAVACEKKLVPRDVSVTVRLPGGSLEISLASANDHAMMRGPARHVFSGHVTA